MKVIVIAGGGRKVGKTTLARDLAGLLPDARLIKVGHHPPKPDGPPGYFLIGTRFQELAAWAGDAAFLIIESGAVLDDPAVPCDLVIFLPDPAGDDKPGSERRRAEADLIRGEPVDVETALALAARLGIEMQRFGALLNLVGVPLNATG